MGWSRWRRVASPGACPYCLMLATRGAVYRNQATALRSSHANDRCGVSIEGNFDHRDDIAIDPADAARRIVYRHQKYGAYEYDLSTYRNLGITASPEPTPPHPVQPPAAPPRPTKVTELPVQAIPGSIDDDVKATNPAFATDPQARIKCVHVAQAFEMRRRGYDVVATPLPPPTPAQGIARGGRNATRELHRVWRDPLEPYAGDARARAITGTPKGLAKQALKWPVGARGFFRVQWQKKHGGGGHIFNIERTQAGVRLVDAQSGKIDASGHLATASSQGAWIVRVDDLELRDDTTVLEFTKPREGVT